MSTLQEHLDDLKRFKDKRDEQAFNVLVWNTLRSHLDEVIAALEAYLTITRPEALSAWISVEDRLPEHDGYIEVLTADARGIVCACDYWSEDKSFWPSNGKGEYWASAYDDITHWMPLPLPPSPQLRGIEPSPTCVAPTGVCLSPRACDYEGKCRSQKPQLREGSDK